MSTIPKSLCKSIKIGSMVRVTLPMFQGAFAIGRVVDFQIVYLDGDIYTFVWVFMGLDGVTRQFSPENLEIHPEPYWQWDNGFVLELLNDGAAA